MDRVNQPGALAAQPAMVDGAKTAASDVAKGSAAPARESSFAVKGGASESLKDNLSQLAQSESRAPAQTSSKADAYSKAGTESTAEKASTAKPEAGASDKAGRSADAGVQEQANQRVVDGGAARAGEGALRDVAQQLNTSAPAGSASVSENDLKLLGDVLGPKANDKAGEYAAKSADYSQKAAQYSQEVASPTVASASKAEYAGKALDYSQKAAEYAQKASDYSVSGESKLENTGIVGPAIDVDKLAKASAAGEPTGTTTVAAQAIAPVRSEETTAEDSSAGLAQPSPGASAAASSAPAAASSEPVSQPSEAAAAAPQGQVGGNVGSARSPGNTGEASDLLRQLLASAGEDGVISPEELESILKLVGQGGLNLSPEQAQQLIADVVGSLVKDGQFSSADAQVVSQLTDALLGGGAGAAPSASSSGGSAPAASGAPSAPSTAAPSSPQAQAAPAPSDFSDDAAAAQDEQPSSDLRSDADDNLAQGLGLLDQATQQTVSNQQQAPQSSGSAGGSGAGELLKRLVQSALPGGLSSQEAQTLLKAANELGSDAGGLSKTELRDLIGALFGAAEQDGDYSASDAALVDSLIDQLPNAGSSGSSGGGAPVVASGGGSGQGGASSGGSGTVASGSSSGAPQFVAGESRLRAPSFYALQAYNSVGTSAGTNGLQPPSFYANAAYNSIKSGGIAAQQPQTALADSTGAVGNSALTTNDLSNLNRTA
jgi:hypothetical protein